MVTFATLLGLVFVLIAAQVQAQDGGEYFSGSIEECARKTNLTLQYVSHYSMEDAENDPRLQCFITCRMLYNENLDGCNYLLLSDQSKEEFSETFEVCREAREATDQCDCGFKWWKCVRAIFNA